MAYISQDMKKTIAAELKKVAPAGMKYSLSVSHNSTICLNIKSSKIDFIGDMKAKAESASMAQYQRDDMMRVRDYMSINPYHYDSHFTPKVAKVIEKLIKALKSAGWYDRSDIQTDHFDTAYYVEVNVGRWNAPYILTK